MITIETWESGSTEDDCALIVRRAQINTMKAIVDCIVKLDGMGFQDQRKALADSAAEIAKQLARPMEKV